MKLPVSAYVSPIARDAAASIALECVCREFFVDKQRILKGERNVEIVAARHAWLWLIRDITGFSYSEISKIVDLHHTSVLYAVRRIDADIRTDSWSCEIMEELRSKVMEKSRAARKGRSR